MKTNTMTLRSSDAIARQNYKTESDAAELNIVAVLDQDLFSECTYGLEYIIDELIPKGGANGDRHAAMDWAGFDDYII